MIELLYTPLVGALAAVTVVLCDRAKARVPQLDGWPGLPLAIAVSIGLVLLELGVTDPMAAARTSGAVFIDSQIGFHGMQMVAARIGRAGTKSPPPSPRAPGEGGPLASIGMVLVLFVALATVGVGCAGRPTLVDAVTVADGAYVTGEAVRPVIKEHCIDPIPTTPDVKALRARCDPAIASWDTLRTGHASLRAGILAVQAGAAGLSTLLVPMGVVGAAAASLAESVQALEGGR